jgi:hypothetical protein
VVNFKMSNAATSSLERWSVCTKLFACSVFGSDDTQQWQ